MFWSRSLRGASVTVAEQERAEGCECGPREGRSQRQDGGGTAEKTPEMSTQRMSRWEEQPGTASWASRSWVGEGPKTSCTEYKGWDGKYWGSGQAADGSWCQVKAFRHCGGWGVQWVTRGQGGPDLSVTGSQWLLPEGEQCEDPTQAGNWLGLSHEVKLKVPCANWCGQGT